MGFKSSLIDVNSLSSLAFRHIQSKVNVWQCIYRIAIMTKNMLLIFPRGLSIALPHTQNDLIYVDVLAEKKMFTDYRSSTI